MSHDVAQGGCHTLLLRLLTFVGSRAFWDACNCSPLGMLTILAESSPVGWAPFPGLMKVLVAPESNMAWLPNTCLVVLRGSLSRRRSFCWCWSSSFRSNFCSCFSHCGSVQTSSTTHDTWSFSWFHSGTEFPLFQFGNVGSLKSPSETGRPLPRGGGLG